MDSDVKKICIKGVVTIDGAIKCHFKASDASTLFYNARLKVERLGQVLVDATIIYIDVTVAAAMLRLALRRKGVRTDKQITDDTKFRAFKDTIYPGRKWADGAWTAESSDFMRDEPDYMTKWADMRLLTKKVMGDADYHSNPCVLMCPFASCKKSHRVLNSIGAVSQLYSHWQKKHAMNPAARELEARWRLAMNNQSKDAAWLDARQPLILTNEEMERLGGKEAGYEQLRVPASHPTDFTHHYETALSL